MEGKGWIMTGVAKRKIAALQQALMKATDPEDAIRVGAGAAGIEETMRRSGLYQTEQIRPARELFLDSRWVLGRMLRKMLRGTAGRPKKNEHRAGANFKGELARLNLHLNRAIEAQRIGTLPVPEKAKAYREAKDQDILPTIELLIDVARPYWYKANRQARHRAIASAAAEFDGVGPFAVLYADPPWTFATYSEKGLERTPAQHYPVQSDEEIIAEFGKIEIHEDAALLMWCTSSNIHRAMHVMRCAGFEYKSQAIWVHTGSDGKPISGMGLVFRNMHDVLLYGTRGNMPGPQYQPPSVFMHQRGAHSAKPCEIRAEIEKMYPDFDEQTRLEMFSRQTTQGWTSHGFEAVDRAAE